MPLKITAKGATGNRRTEPLWKGPCVDGVTQSMLGRYLACPERFRIKTIEGWEVKDHFRHALEYGNMWHICEEHLAAGKSWDESLETYANGLMQRYPFQRLEVVKWYNTCRTQFPLYVEHWKRNPDVIDRQPLMQEYEFAVPYELPSGVTVLLRGKFDSVDVINGKVWLQENKTKSEIDQEQLTKQLSFDLQTMLYLIALSSDTSPLWETSDGRPPIVPKSLRKPIAGVRYNVIRRPLSGGKGTIKQSDGTKGSACPKCKGTGKLTDKTFLSITATCQKCHGKGRIGAKPPETDDQFYGRLAQYIKDEPKEYFQRWQVSVSQKDMDVFEKQTLIPLLENLCNDYEWWCECFKPDSNANRFKWLWDIDMRYKLFPKHGHCHYRYPYGVYNPLNDGGYTELDEYLANGSIATLQQCKDLFPELKGT